MACIAGTIWRAALRDRTVAERRAKVSSCRAAMSSTRRASPFSRRTANCMACWRASASWRSWSRRSAPRAPRHRGGRGCAYRSRGRTQPAPAGIPRREHGAFVAAATLPRSRAGAAAIEAGRRGGGAAACADCRRVDGAGARGDRGARGAGRRRRGPAHGTRASRRRNGPARQRAACGQRSRSGARPWSRAGARRPSARRRRPVLRSARAEIGWRNSRVDGKRWRPSLVSSRAC